MEREGGSTCLAPARCERRHSDGQNGAERWTCFAAGALNQRRGGQRAGERVDGAWTSDALQQREVEWNAREDRHASRRRAASGGIRMVRTEPSDGRASLRARWIRGAAVRERASALTVLGPRTRCSRE